MAECYWYTMPSASWTLTLVADPLYTPFKRNPKMTIARMREVIGMPPPAPRPAEPAKQWKVTPRRTGHGAFCGPGAGRRNTMQSEMPSVNAPSLAVKTNWTA